MAAKTQIADFASRLRALREAAGLSIYELARRVGLSRSHLGGLESGKYQPTLDTARKLGRALGKKSLSCWN